MTQVTYRGKVEELLGTTWDVPASVVAAKQAASWIESQHREQLARDAAEAEAERRQQELLAARLEEQRQRAEAEMAAAEAAPVATREELKAELREELDDLTRAVLTGAAAVESKELAIIQRTDEWEGRHESLLAKQEETAAVAAEQVVAAQATTQASVETISAELSEHRDRVAELERELRTVVSGLVGPQGDKGDRGLAGSGIGYVDADPTRIEQGSLGQRFYGRPVVPGDILLQRTADALLVWRTADGKTWKQIDEILNRQEFVSQQLSVLDQSTPTTLIQTISGGGGGGGGGGEPLLSNRAALSVSVPIADTSNWAGTNTDPTSGQAVIEITALDGALAGKKGFACVDFLWEPSGAKETQAALLGDLNGSFDVNLSYVRGAASVPAGVIATLPTAATALRVFITVVPTPGSGGSGGVTQFRLAGDIEWAHQSLGRAVPVNSAGIQPLWRWV
jgi:hypothetical protein